MPKPAFFFFLLTGFFHSHRKTPLNAANFIWMALLYSDAPCASQTLHVFLVSLGGAVNAPHTTSGARARVYRLQIRHRSADIFRIRAVHICPSRDFGSCRYLSLFSTNFSMETPWPRIKTCLLSSGSPTHSTSRESGGISGKSVCATTLECGNTESADRRVGGAMLTVRGRREQIIVVLFLLINRRIGERARHPFGA